MRALAALVAGFCVWVAVPARADVTLRGEQHVGDAQSASFTPSDPVTRLQMLNNPSRFHLTQEITVSRLRLDAPVYQVPGLAGLVAVEVDHVSLPGTFLFATNSFVFSRPHVFSAGTHQLGVDPGCLNPSSQPGNCAGPGHSENDIGFGSMTLVSPQTTASRALNRRRHVGDDVEPVNDNYLGAYYPDNLDAAPNDVRADIPFTVDLNRVLNLIQVYRLRGVETTTGNHAQILIDGKQVGLLAASGDPYAVPVTLALASGSHTLSIVSGSVGAGNRDSISWDDVILQFSAPIGGIPGRFNAVDPGGAAASGPITTKVAGLSFALDIVALDLAGAAQLTDYTGTVVLELLDASNDGGAADAYGCRSSWPSVQALGTLSLGASDTGRRSVAIAYGDGLQIARIRVLDTATGIAGCSVDAFAIRPSTFLVQVSHGGASTAGTTALLDDTLSTGTATHRAGQPFTVRATARAAGGAMTASYAGSPTLSVQSTIQGAVAGTLSDGSWSGAGTRRTDNARYTEAGTFNLRVSDATFASVDSADTPLANREIFGTVGVGRFTPDHFALVSRNVPVFAPACGSFGYVGQPFDYATAPEAMIEAVNAAGGRTLNYEGALYKLPGTVGASTYLAKQAVSAQSVALDTILLPTPDRDLVSTGAGTARLTYVADANIAALRSLPVAPYDIEIELRVPTIQDSDGIVYDDPATEPLTFGATTAGNGIAFTGGAKQQRFGRLYLTNGYGSERLPLDLTYGAEYYLSAASGFGRNLADTCSAGGAVTLSEGISASTSVVGVPSALVAGQGTIRLAAPSVGGRLKVSLDGVSWLGTDADGDGSYGDPASAEAAFGQFREGDKQIYLRETYR